MRASSFRLCSIHLVLIIIFCIVLMPPAHITIAAPVSSPVAPLTTNASSSLPTERCTNWPAAGYRDSDETTLVDTPIDNYTTSLLGFDEPDFPIDHLPTAAEKKDWRVLIRPDVTFAVFYTENANPTDAIGDPGYSSVTAYGNFDEDGDSVPDYAERVIHCLAVAHDRYALHYAVNQSFEHSLKYLYLRYTDPFTGNEELQPFYPVVIRQEGLKGAVYPVIFANRLQFNSIMTINQDFFVRDVIEVHPWLYPDLESTLYHELAHVYQAIFSKHLETLGSLWKWWVLEGSAVYVADQALLPTCTTDADNPPRINLSN